MNRIQYKACPICGSENIRFNFTTQDYAVSKEMFEVWACDNCTNQFTQNIPNRTDIGAYYQSPEYVSHSETKSGLINRLYHLVRKITLRSKQNWVKVSTGLKQGNLLDIGSGAGSFLYYMKAQGWQVTGIEPDAGARKNALQLYGLDTWPLEHLPHLQAHQFDCITLWHVLEHVHDLDQTIEQIKKLLKPNGAILIAVPNFQSVDAKAYGPVWAAYDVPRHLYHFSPPGMQHLLGKYELTLEQTYPMMFDAFYVSMLSERYRKGSIWRAGWMGLRSYWKAWKATPQCSSIVYVCKIKA
jgi:2-polyprenyl-3-methyl-5-hydroxy-6-metoxy-1,4-benzoquinol methylase